MKPAFLFPPKGSLRRRVFMTGMAGITLAAVSLVAVLGLGVRAQDEISAATDSFVEEQAIADRINQAVMRQLLAVSAIQAGTDTIARPDFAAAGQEAYTQIRHYLLRDLTTEQRLQLERVKEGQQRLEVAALHATTAYADGAAARGDEAFETMVSHGFDLLNAVAGFLGMRESGLLALRVRQKRAFQMAYGVGFGLAALLMLGSLAVGWMLQRRVNVPLSVLDDAVGRIAEGDLDVRVPDLADSEFSRLATRFNQMAVNLRTLQGDLERRNAELEAAVETMHRTRSELMQSEKLSTVGRMTAGLAHELNNPLASILGYGELLEAELGRERPPSIREIRDDFVRPIVEEARRSHHMTRSLLIFSRRSEATVGAVPLRESLDVAANLRSFAFVGVGLALLIENVPDVYVLADRQHLQETFFNILNNALHALQSHGGTRVRVSGRVEGGELVLEFEDDGPGFEQPELALEPFYTTKPPDEGTGLGLPMVARYMDECSGTVRLSNVADGGARVELRFRLAEAPARAEATAAEPTWGEEPAPFARNRRILVVEDEPHLRVIHERLLSRAGASIRAVSNVREAKAVLHAETIDLVISDVRMPGEGGVSLYEWVISEHPGLRDHFLFVTGDTRSPDILELAEAHPEMFLRKPFEVADYMKRVEAILG